MTSINFVMQPPSILRPANPPPPSPPPPLPLGLTTSHPLQAKQPVNLSDFLGQPTAPYFDFSYLSCILFNYNFDLCNNQLFYFLIVKDYKQSSYVRVQSVFDVNIIQFQTWTETCFCSFFVIPILIPNFNAILVQVLNQLILIPITLGMWATSI